MYCRRFVVALFTATWDDSVALVDCVLTSVFNHEPRSAPQCNTAWKLLFFEAERMRARMMYSQRGYLEDARK